MGSTDMKRAIVTGAASGFGRALSLAFSREGCKVLLADIDKEGREETLGLIKKEGGSGEVIKCDVTSENDVKKMVDFAYKKWGGVDLMINNAGIGAGGAVGEFPMDQFRKVVDINFWGMVYGCNEIIPRMKKAGSGYIINVSSAAAFTTLPEMAAYNTSKAAVMALSETIYTELAPHNIGVTVVCPTFFNTNIIEDMAKGGRYPDESALEFGREGMKNAPMTADDIADKVAKAVKKGRLYVVPQPIARQMWLTKRLLPAFYYKQIAKLMKSGGHIEYFIKQAKKGKA